MATTDSRQRIPLLRVPAVTDYDTPGWYERLPRRVGAVGMATLLTVIAAYIRAHFLDGELWSDEANTIGIASHSFGSIPGILWKGGGAPAYFLILHVWIAWFGDSEIAAHMLSVLCGVLVVPVGMWLGWSLYGRRVGLMFATLLTFNSFLTKFSEEARPYTMLALVGLFATGSFMHAFVYRHRRGWLPGFAVSLAALVYVDAWGFFVWIGFGLALIVIGLRSDAADRRAIARDGAIAFFAAFVLYLPWLPTLIHQAASSTDPWHYAPHLGANVLRDMLGSDRVTALFALAVVIGLVPLLTGPERRGVEATGVWVTLTIWLGAVLLALLLTVFLASFTDRYLAAVIAPMLLLLAIACARARSAGLVLLVVACLFTADPGSFVAGFKSDMRDVAAEVSPYVSRGDLVLVTQPEQTPLAWYYLPAGLKYATTLGPDPHPSYMNWDNAQTRLRDAKPVATLNRLVAGMHAGQRLLVIRPMTEGVWNWTQDWSNLVRLRSAQWAQAIADDPLLAQLPGVYAPHNYPGSCCTASSALVFVKR
jgi:mannosyltransferase